MFLGLFFIDAGENGGLWLWQGWWPEVGHEAGDTNTTTGSGLIRWHSERRAAMQTISEYSRIKYRRSVKAVLVWAGHEPQEFIDLFPYWTVDDTVTELNQQVSPFFGYQSVAHCTDELFVVAVC